MDLFGSGGWHGGGAKHSLGQCSPTSMQNLANKRRLHHTPRVSMQGRRSTVSGTQHATADMRHRASHGKRAVVGGQRDRFRPLLACFAECVQLKHQVSTDRVSMEVAVSLEASVIKQGAAQHGCAVKRVECCVGVAREMFIDHCFGWHAYTAVTPLGPIVQRWHTTRSLTSSCNEPRLTPPSADTDPTPVKRRSAPVGHWAPVAVHDPPRPAGHSPLG